MSVKRERETEERQRDRQRDSHRQRDRQRENTRERVEMRDGQRKLTSLDHASVPLRQDSGLGVCVWRRAGCTKDLICSDLVPATTP